MREISNPDDHLRLNKLADCGKDGGARMWQAIVHGRLSQTAAVAETTIRQNISRRINIGTVVRTLQTPSGVEKKVGLPLPTFTVWLAAPPAEALSQFNAVLSVKLCTLCVCMHVHTPSICLFKCFLFHCQYPFFQTISCLTYADLQPCFPISMLTSYTSLTPWCKQLNPYIYIYIYIERER